VPAPLARANWWRAVVHRAPGGRQAQQAQQARWVWYVIIWFGLLVSSGRHFLKIARLVAGFGLTPNESSESVTVTWPATSARPYLPLLLGAPEPRAWQILLATS